MEKYGDCFASGFFVSVPLSVQKPLSTSHGDERDRKGMQGRVKLPCTGYMQCEVCLRYFYQKPARNGLYADGLL